MKGRESKKILGIDYGTTNIGLSFSHGYLAEPLTTVKFSTLSETLGKIKKIVQKQGIKKIVVGVAEGRIEKKTEEFVRRLKKITQIPVILWDETLTSYQAKVAMRQTGKSLVKRREQEHEVAASLILQDYLDCLKNNC